MMKFTLAGKATDVFKELTFLAQLEKKLGQVLIKFKSEPGENIQN